MEIKKKILIACPLRGRGGVETHVLRLADLLNDHGADVTVVSRIVNADAPVDWFRNHRNLRFLTTPFSVHPSWPRAAMAWSIYAWPRILPSDFDLLYTFDVSRTILALKSVLNEGGLVIANRAGAAPPDGHVAAPQVEEILNGFVTETETQAAGYDTRVATRAIPLLALEAAPLRAGRSLNRSRLRVAYLGRYERPKGIFRLVDIWNDARPHAAELAFYGVGPDRRGLEEYIRAKGLGADATVNDSWITSAEQAAILANVDLVMLPSDSEGFPLVLLEAMAHGVPFIATDVGGIRELARDNPDVAVVPLDNAAFANALGDMLRRIRDGELSAERLQRYYAERYAPEKIAAQWRAALLEPEKFWGPRASASKERRANHGIE